MSGLGANKNVCTGEKNHSAPPCTYHLPPLQVCGSDPAVKTVPLPCPLPSKGKANDRTGIYAAVDGVASDSNAWKMITSLPHDGIRCRVRTSPVKVRSFVSLLFNVDKISQVRCRILYSCCLVPVKALDDSGRGLFRTIVSNFTILIRFSCLLVSKALVLWIKHRYVQLGLVVLWLPKCSEPALVVPFPSTKSHCSSPISGLILLLILSMMILRSSFVV